MIDTLLSTFILLSMSDNTNQILQILYRHQDVKYGDFMHKLVPTLPREIFIGIRAPEFKKILKEVHAEAEAEIVDFMKSLPHHFQEENTLQVCLINQIKNYEEYIEALEAFLPYVDNWAISDGLGAKCLEKNKDKLILKVSDWLKSDLPYTKRVAMLFLRKYFITDDFKTDYLDWVAEIRSDHYYVNMMTAWLFADVLVTQWDSAVEFLKARRLDSWTHNKAIQKARESFRITDEQKEFLKTLKV